MINDAVKKRRKRARIAEGTRVDAVKHGSESRVELVFLVEVSVAELIDIFGEVAEEEDVVLADFARDFDLSWSACESWINIRMLTFAPSQVPMIRPPFRQNFMLLVPEASVPAVEMCSEMSLAGVMISALLTL